MGDSRKVDNAGRAKPHNSRPTIGLLMGELEERYQSLVWPGIADVAQERDVNLICFVGRSLRSPYEFDTQRNAIYDLVSAENVDGLVVMSGTLSNYIEFEEFREFCERYRPLPMVSVALAVEGMPSVLVDNERGMRDAITHLIEVHGYRRIAFIRGPEGHQEAEARYRAYTEVLAEQGLPLDPDLIAPGDFVLLTGVEAVRLLLDQRKVDLEAVVAANDSMALGALEALQARAISAPGDVAVVGFDDIEESRHITPPLTTVRQPLYKQGRQAGEMLLAMLEGEGVPEQVTLPTELVVRRSCGCLDPVVMQARVGQVERTVQSFEAALGTWQEHICSEMVQATEAHSVDGNPQWAERLLDAFSAQLKGESPDAFLPTLDEILGEVVAEGREVALWQGAISALRCRVLPFLVSNQEALSQAEDLWQQARVLIGETDRRAQANQRLRARTRALTVSGISEALMTTVDVAQLTDVMIWGLPRLGIKGCYLSLYEGEEAPAEWSRLILAYDEGKHLELETGGRRFPSRKLVPDSLLPHRRQYTMVLEPLSFRGEQIGFALFEMGPREGMIYETLRGQISSALKGTLLFVEHKRAEEEIRQLKEFNEGIVQGMEEGIVMEDAEGHIAFVNPKMAELLGYTEEELMGKHWSETVAPSCLRQVEEESSKRPKGIGSRYEAVLLRKDGGEVPGLVSATPLFKDGEFAGTLVVFTDLTERKEMEQQLIQAGKLAAIGQLVAGVAHELNNPLTSVVGYSQLLMGAECSEEIKRDLERINRQGVRAARIVENLLTFARRREPRKEWININDVIERSLELLGHQLALDRISIVRELDGALPPTVADPFQMQQVFMNIISNAHQALRDWGGERELRVRSELQGDMIHLEFADSGPGISPEVMGRLFEPFFTTRQVGEGTGLGLSISYGIVEAHGGRIWAESPSTGLRTGPSTPRQSLSRAKPGGSGQASPGLRTEPVEVTGEVGKGATFIVEIPVKGA